MQKNSQREEADRWRHPEARKGKPETLQREHGSAHTLISYFQPPESTFPSAFLSLPLSSTLTAATGNLSTQWVLDLRMAAPCCHGLVTLELMVQLSREAVGLLRRADVTLPAEEESQVQTVQCRSVAQSWPTLCDPMDCSTPGFSVHHQLWELAQTHVHRVGDATQPSHLRHPLLLTSIFSQGLFQWVSSLQQVAKVLELQLQHQSFHWIFRTDLL